MRLFTSPDPVPDFLDGPSIFLAGSIEMGKATDWQKDVIEALTPSDLAVFNPRREVWDPTWHQSIDNPLFAEQVNWELDQIDRADIVLFFFDGGTLSPISLLELGLSIGSGATIIVVAEKNYWRLGNIEIMCQRHNIPLFHTIQEGIEELRRMGVLQPAN